MSTRSYICKENKDGSYTGIYCHSDGYLTYNGAMLLDHYNTEERVNKLLSLGDISILCSKIEPEPNKEHGFDFDKRQEDVTVFYGRDRGESGTEAKAVNLKDIDSPDSWIEYCYIFGCDGKWKYFECGSLEEGIKDLNEGLNKEYKKLGFSRPSDTYGYFTESEIEKYKELEKKNLEME